LTGTNLNDPTKVFTPLTTPTFPTGASLLGDSFVLAEAQLNLPNSSNASLYAQSSLTATATVTPPSGGTQVGIGWTVVMTSGPNIGLRRQVVAIADITDLTLDSAFTFATGGTYRIDNPLNTYNGPILTDLETAIATELATISTGPESEQTSLINFFTTVFTTVVGPSPNGVVSGNTLADTTVDFVAAGVTTSYLVYIHVGSVSPQLNDMGVYQIGTVVDSHHLTLNQSVPTAGTVTYEVVSLFGTTYTTLNSIFSILIANEAFIPLTQAFQTILITSVPVLLSGVTDPAEYANGIGDTADDLGSRYSVALNRLTYVTGPTGPIPIITAALNATDQLYNKRYVWIDARINLQTGLLVLEQTAVAQRIAQQAQVFNQLIKLLTVQGS
jgi:hypothetical protein